MNYSVISLWLNKTSCLEIKDKYVRKMKSSKILMWKVCWIFFLFLLKVLVFITWYFLMKWIFSPEKFLLGLISSEIPSAVQVCDPTSIKLSFYCLPQTRRQMILSLSLWRQATDIATILLKNRNYFLYKFSKDLVK